MDQGGPSTGRCHIGHSPGGDDSYKGGHGSDDVPAELVNSVYAEAVQTVTSQLIHEIEPLLGMLRLAAEAEVPISEFEHTRKLDRLDDLLGAIARLRRAASAPKSEEFSLDDLVQRCIQEANVPSGVKRFKKPARNRVPPTEIAAWSYSL